MSAQIIPFEFEAHAVRVLERDGAPWFVAADVCRVLEIGNPRDALSRLDDDERDGVGIADAMGREQVTNLINESGLYALVLTSRKPAAKRFRKWVTAEVLPALRRTGRYELPHAEAMHEISAGRLIELLESENALLRSKVPAARAKRKRPLPISEAERAEILRLVQAGLSAGQIAKLMGRSRAAISMLRSGFKVIEGEL